VHARAEVLQWLFWLIGGLGPMAGQNRHFSRYAPEKIPCAIDRYERETGRPYGVLDKRLAGRSYVAGEDHSIADMDSYPWIVPHTGKARISGIFPTSIAGSRPSAPVPRPSLPMLAPRR
jgi:GST-like protein